MGKRSSFERNPRDYYPTPYSAVVPLGPHLEDGWFIEPCAGDGRLATHIEKVTAGGTVLYSYFDVEPQHPSVLEGDALTLPVDRLSGADYIITNPPWDVKVLHPMIERFSGVCPTWLLFYADWMHTKQAIPFLPSLVKVVSVGRVKWIEDSPSVGKDNCAWYLFDKAHAGPTEFYGRTADA